MHFMQQIDDTRINGVRPLIPPAILMEDVPLDEQGAEFIANARKCSEAIIEGKDDRLLVIVGPCSIHDPKAALEYAAKLKPLMNELEGSLQIVMRVYFEKPRTVVGWKGLINDPFIDGSFRINEGLRMARKLLIELTQMGVPVAVEFLDTIMPQFIADAVTWGAIGARTTESQSHRELASGLSMPIGFKNGTDGQIQIAVDAIAAARVGHWFTSITKQGVSAIFATAGNPHCHLILRGGKKSGPNYDAASIQSAVDKLEERGVAPRLMVDFSHGNCQKDFSRQKEVCADVCQQLSSGSKAIVGVMIESHLVEGRQDYQPDKDAVYGQSITDACLGFDDTVVLLRDLAKAVLAGKE